MTNLAHSRMRLGSISPLRKWRGLRHCVPLAAIAVLAVTPPQTFAADKKAVENHLSKMATQDADLDRRSRATIDGVQASVLRDLEAKRQKLARDIVNWREDLAYETITGETFVDVKALRRGVADALQVAKLSGLDVQRPTRIYEMTKRVIRNADFAIPGKPHIDRDDRPHRQVARLFSYATHYEQILAEQRLALQRYKLGLYKRATVAFIRALNATAEPAEPCTPKIGNKKIRVGGAYVPSANCPSPVVRNLRAYLSAIRKIQSADADALRAEAELLQAEQQFLSDVIAGVPIVGETLDIYAIYAGHDLAGRPVSFTVRSFMTVILSVMLINSKTAQKLFDQVAKRSSTAAQIFDKMNAFFRGRQYALSDAWWRFKMGSRGAADMFERLAGKWGSDGGYIQRFGGFLKRRWGTPVGDTVPAHIRIYQNLRDAASDRIQLLDMPPNLRNRVMQQARRNVDEGARVITHAQSLMAKKSGIHPDHFAGFSQAAQEFNQIIIVRPVNRRATARIGQGWSTKFMGIKSKSASHGPIAGALPVDQNLNKVGTKLKQLKEKIRRQGTKSAKDANDLIKLEGEIAKGAKEMKKCLADPKNCAKAVTYMVEGGQPLLTLKRADGETVYAVRNAAGEYVDYESKQVIKGGVSGVKEVQVLADAKTGKMLAADYDILNYAEQAQRHQTPGYSDATGFITRMQEKIVARLNKLFGHEGGNLVHHGAEQNFFRSPGVDYPLTIFQPDGRMFLIPQCDLSCMKSWCSRNKGRCHGGDLPVDPDRLLKDFFHERRMAGFNLDANQRWGWGPFNGISGWASRLTNPIARGQKGEGHETMRQMIEGARPR